jgi:membrane protease YdiL (CAAX protease family)
MRIAGCLNRPPVRSGRIGYVFLGPAGVRAGWRVALYVLLCVAVFFSLVAGIRHLSRTMFLSPPVMIQGGLLVTPRFAVINEVLLGVPVILTSLTMAWLEGCSPLAFGLAGLHRGRRLGFGLVVGCVSLSLLIVLLLVFGFASMEPAGGGVRPAVEWALVCLAIGFVEEYGFRGYLLQALARCIGFWPAAVATSLLFGAAHGINPGETPVGLINAALIAFVLCISLARTGALWWAIGYHAAWDYAEDFIYGAHDSGTVSAGAATSLTPHGNIWLSGGATGPEGSLFCTVVVILIGAGLWRVFPAPARLAR